VTLLRLDDPGRSIEQGLGDLRAAVEDPREVVPASAPKLK